MDGGLVTVCCMSLNMSDIPKKRGGPRPNSGRPRVDSQGINLRLKRETIEWIDAQEGRRSEVVEQLVKEKRGEQQ
jgi:hypothetical protein